VRWALFDERCASFAWAAAHPLLSDTCGEHGERLRSQARQRLRLVEDTRQHVDLVPSAGVRGLRF
jgi:hypothetical protein